MDALAWSEADFLLAHFRQEPPAGACIRAYLGIEGESQPAPSPKSSEPEELSQDEFERLKAQIAADAERNGRARR